MSFFIDLIIAAVFIIALIAGWRRGFVRAVMRVISLVGAIVITWLLYNPVSNFLYEKIVLGKVSGYIGGAFDKDVASTGKSLSDLFREMPEFFRNFLDRFSTEAKATEFYQQNAEATGKELSDFMAQPIARTIATVAAIILLFVVAYIALKLLTTLLDRVVRLPLLNGVNHALGLILGAVVGLAVAWLLAIAFHAAVPTLSSLYPNVFKENTFDNTVITKALYNFNLLKVLDIFNI